MVKNRKHLNFYASTLFTILRLVQLINQSTKQHAIKQSFNASNIASYKLIILPEEMHK